MKEINKIHTSSVDKSFFFVGKYAYIKTTIVSIKQHNLNLIKMNM